MLGSGKRKLLRMFPKDSIGAEIGVWKGGFSQLLLEIVKPQTLYLIDPWEFRSEYPGSLYGGGEAKNQAHMDAIYQRVLQKFSQEISDNLVQIIRGRSASVLPGFADGHLDWIYIDGDHTFEVCREDLKLAAKKVKPEGVISGSEYSKGGWWQDGVTRAVDEYVTDTGAELVRVGGSHYILNLTV